MSDLVKVRVHAVNEKRDSAGRGYPQAVSCEFDSTLPSEVDRIADKIKEFDELGGSTVRMLVEVVKDGDVPSWEQ